MADPTRRKPVAKRLRFEVLRRDNHTCRYCGATAPDVRLAVDHVIPVVLGGTDDPSNLVTACVECNGGKTSVAPDQATIEDVSNAQLRWARALEAAAEQRRAEMRPDQHTATVAAFEEMWDQWTVGGRMVPRADRWADSVRVWVSNGLNIDDLTHFTDVAMRNSAVNREDKWRYFCGCCWKESRRRDELAQTIVQKPITPLPDSKAPEPAESILDEFGAWAYDENGHALYVNASCAGCEGTGYCRNGAEPYELDECWCISSVPYEYETR